MKRFKQCVYQLYEKNFIDGCSHYNSLNVRRASRSKFLARKAFKENNIPYAKGLIFFWPWTAVRFIKKQGFPVVLKPNVGGYSRGSFFPIKTWGAFWKAMFLVKFWWPKTVIETYFQGKNYRVVVTQAGTEIVMRRYPPFVEGDGTHSISQLIDQENRIREKMNLYPVIHEIPKDKRVQKFLKQQQLTLSSVPKKSQIIELYHRIALSPGGSLKNISLEKVTKKNKKIFEKILKLFKANIFGVDVIMEEGIGTDYDKQKCIFLELNSRPYLKMHDYPRWGEKPDLNQFYKRLEILDIEDKNNF
jgi:D-alanine-D-alanine ligase-like ATP-grasp enzyme